MTHSVDKPDISNAEFDVLDALWEDSPATSADVIARLNKHKDWHEKTVKTLLGRLVKKGAYYDSKSSNVSTCITLLLRGMSIQKKKQTASLVACSKGK